MNRLFLLLAGACLVFSVKGQSTTSVSGTVTDNLGTAIPGASVHVLNAQLGTITDASGNFKVNVEPGKYTLQISSVGYSSTEFSVSVTQQESTEPVRIQLVQSATRLDDVIITAQKREDDLQKVPVSVSSLNSRQVQEYRLWNTRELTAIVPNLFSSNPGDNRNVTSIRGITSTSYDPAVATYIDGVNQFGLDTYIAQLFDVERIEVLRGPQGTLYGRNAMGGVINIITKQPENRTSSFAEMNLGNFGQQRYGAGLRTALIKDKLFLGVAGVYDGTDGFYTNQFNQSKFDSRTSYTGNYYIKYYAGSRWRLTYNLKHNENRNHGPFTLAYLPDATESPFVVNQNAVTKMIDNVFNTSFVASYSGAHFNFSSQTAYQANYRYYQNPIDGDFSPLDAVTIINNYGKQWNNIKVWTQEFRFSSPGNRESSIQWTAGAYFFHQNSPVKQATHFGEQADLIGAQPNLTLISTTKSQTVGAAMFGQATWRVADKLDLLGGIRYDYERKRQNVHGVIDPDFDFQADTTATVSYGAFSPKAGLQFHFNENHTAFATYTRGYRSGGLTPLQSDPSQPAQFSYRPEYSGNAEIGIKNNFLNSRLRANFSLFYIRVTDAQVPTLILPQAITVTRNGGKLESKGAELELSSLLAKGLQLDYNAGLTDAHYVNADSKPVASGPVDFVGKKQIFTPSSTSMLAVQYSLVLSEPRKIKLVARGEWMYQGKKYFDLANTISQSGYNLLNTRFGVVTPQFELFFWGRNLADQKYIEYAYDFGAARLGNPRNVGVSMIVRL